MSFLYAKIYQLVSVLFKSPVSKVETTHLSKRPSDLKQNGTEEKTPFSGTVFHALSHGAIRFVASVSSKTHFLTG